MWWASEKERERLSAGSAVLAGFHIILRGSPPPTGKFSEITSFNYLLPTALAGWRCTDAGWLEFKQEKCGQLQPCNTLLCLSSDCWTGRGLRVLICVRVCWLSTYRSAEVGWAPACRSRRTLRFQSAEPLCQSPPPPVPAAAAATSITSAVLLGLLSKSNLITPLPYLVIRSINN